MLLGMFNITPILLARHFGAHKPMADGVPSAFLLWLPLDIFPGIYRVFTDSVDRQCLTNREDYVTILRVLPDKSCLPVVVS